MINSKTLCCKATGDFVGEEVCLICGHSQCFNPPVATLHTYGMGVMTAGPGTKPSMSQIQWNLGSLSVLPHADSAHKGHSCIMSHVILSSHRKGELECTWAEEEPGWIPERVVSGRTVLSGIHLQTLKVTGIERNPHRLASRHHLDILACPIRGNVVSILFWE